MIVMLLNRDQIAETGYILHHLASVVAYWFVMVCITIFPGTMMDCWVVWHVYSI